MIGKRNKISNLICCSAKSNFLALNKAGYNWFKIADFDLETRGGEGSNPFQWSLIQLFFAVTKFCFF